MNTKRTDYRAKQIKPMLLATLTKHSFGDEELLKAREMIKDFCDNKMSFVIFNDDHSLKFIMSKSPKSQKKIRIAL